MKSTPSLRKSLEERLSPVRTLILDEVYFLNANDLARASEYVSMGKGNTEHIFGGLNWVTCGDPCQLPPPQGHSLFSRGIVQCHLNDVLNDLHERNRQEVKGIQVWHQVQHIVVLDEIMRQRDDPVLLDILKRLRKGSCTEGDKEILDKYVLSTPDCSEETKRLTDPRRWVEDPGNACPLIVYTNAARDAHNWNMAEVFAEVTGQPCNIYHAMDTRGRGSKKAQLAGLVAEVSWAIPVKDANDLGGKVPYMPGMSVFCTENIATELGLSNGSPGVIVSIVFEEIGGRRYAISADVDFEAYRKSAPNAPHPHRVTLKPISQTIHFRLPGSDKLYSAR
jgi:ATP-dependent DNA helicase PIF1